MAVLMPGMSLDNQRVEVQPKSVSFYFFVDHLGLFLLASLFDFEGKRQSCRTLETQENGKYT
jgi:hypothetical protein